MSSAHNDIHEEQTDDRLDRLLLAVEAIWELVRERTGLTDEELFRRIAALDLEDGVADRRSDWHGVPCACGARFNRMTHRCDFCGEMAPIRSLFDLV
jgi:hypothetical protein